MRSILYFFNFSLPIFDEIPYFCTPLADVAKLADALDLGSSGAIHVGSTPIIRTTNPLSQQEGEFFNIELVIKWQQ